MRPSPLATAFVCTWLAAYSLTGASLSAQPAETPGDAWMGLYIRSVDSEDIEALDLEAGVRGVVVTAVDDDGPAARAGVEPGDVVTQFDGKNVFSRSDFTSLLAEHTVGDQVELVVTRSGKEKRFSFKLKERPAGRDPLRFATPRRIVPSDPLRAIWRGGPQLGIRTLDLESDALAAYFGLKAGEGVLVTGVVEHSGAERAGIEPGDVIVAVQDRPVANTADIRLAVGDLETGDEVEVRLRRQNRRQTVTVELGESVTISDFNMPLPNGSWRLQNDVGDLRREMDELRQELRRLERQLQRRR